jgi:hypothetical protein
MYHDCIGVTHGSESKMISSRRGDATQSLVHRMPEGDDESDDDGALSWNRNHSSEAVSAGEEIFPVSVAFVSSFFLSPAGDFFPP